MDKRKRKSKSFRTDAFKRLVTPVVLFVDGQTEIDYFQRINQLEMFPYLSIKGKIGGYESFQHELEKIDPKTSFLILDIDDHGANTTSTDFQKIKTIIDSNSDTTFFSNYAFEVWLLLHKISKPPYSFNGSKLNRQIQKKFGLKDNWNKSEEQRKIIMAQISPEMIEKAQERNKTFCSEWFTNPSTNLDQLFEKMKAMNPDSPQKIKEE